MNNVSLGFIFFFFKQKTAYEIASCLVGSEMCIRDRTLGYLICQFFARLGNLDKLGLPVSSSIHGKPLIQLLPGGLRYSHP